jgi:diguanylate cyclase (GGDEF)-like protein
MPGVLRLFAPDYWRRTTKPVEFIAWVGVACSLFSLLFLPYSGAEKWIVLAFTLALALYVLLFFHWLTPRYGMRPLTTTIGAVGGIVLVSWAYALWGGYGLRVDLLFMAIVATSGFVSGRNIAVLTALLSAAGGAAVAAVVLEQPPSVAQNALTALIYLAGGLLASDQASTIRQQAEEARQRNLELGFLLEASEAVSSLDLQMALPRLAEQIAKKLPATYCRICLLDASQSQLIIEGTFPLRPLPLDGSAQRTVWPLNDMPNVRRAISTGTTTILRRDAPQPFNAQESDRLMVDGTQSVCLVPLAVQGQPLGLIVISEMRQWQREPFDENRVRLLQLMAPQVAVVIQNARLHAETQRQRDRLDALLRVSQAVSSTIEMDTLLEMIHNQLNLVLPSDTYFVGLYSPQEQTFDLRVLIDDGERFPPQRISVGEGLASHVIRSQQPLLVRCLSREIVSLPVKPIILGQQRVSESWLGVPMVLGSEVLGILAVASYPAYAFDEDDLALLQNVAQQATLALDNARHHAQVEDQARRDSLTRVFNHRYLLDQLHKLFAQCQQSGRPLSLIMLDIDHFKQYNDRYGHVVGDDVLGLVAQAIQTHLKPQDIVGRWGGEEFTVALPGAATDQAYSVAEHMRRTLASLPLADSSGAPIPKPTISQGVATFPHHADDVANLIVAADRTLYVAKAAGRDQIRLAAAIGDSA